MEKTITYKNLEEEFELTFAEMEKVSIKCGDEVLYWDTDDDVHVGKIIGTENFPGNRDEPPSLFYTVLKDDGTEATFEDEYVMKRKSGKQEGVTA